MAVVEVTSAKGFSLTALQTEKNKFIFELRPQDDSDNWNFFSTSSTIYVDVQFHAIQSSNDCESDNGV